MPPTPDPLRETRRVFFFYLEINYNTEKLEIVHLGKTKNNKSSLSEGRGRDQGKKSLSQSCIPLLNPTNPHSHLSPELSPIPSKQKIIATNDGTLRLRKENQSIFHLILFLKFLGGGSQAN